MLSTLLAAEPIAASGTAAAAATTEAATSATGAVLGTGVAALAGIVVVTALVGYLAVFGATVGADIPFTDYDVCFLWCQDLKNSLQDADQAQQHLVATWIRILTKRASEGFQPLARGVRAKVNQETGGLKRLSLGDWRGELKFRPDDTDGLSFFDYLKMPPSDRNRGLFFVLALVPTGAAIQGVPYPLVLPTSCTGTPTEPPEGRWSVNCSGGDEVTTNELAEYANLLYNPPLRNPKYIGG